jgi:hypothetical protein
MGKYDDILAGFQAPAADSSFPPQGSGKYADILAAFPLAQSNSKPQSTENKWLRRASTYGVHPLIEGGAMGVAGTAGAVMAVPAGPVASAVAAPALAIAAYPPAHAAANAIDRAMGLETQDTPLPQALKEGATMEAAGAAIPAVGKAVADIPFAKFGAAFSGTPASNLTRAYQKGLSTYVAKPLAEAGENYGKNESRIMMNAITPQEQADAITNAAGTAATSLNKTIVKYLSGEDISVKEALQAKQSLSSLYPSDTAKKAVLRGKMAQFGDMMNEVIAKADPAMAKANSDYADSALRSQLLQLLRVNKSNPNEPSKLGIMLASEGIAKSDNPFEQAVKVFTLQSPAFMGFVSSLSGQLRKLIPTLPIDKQRAAARSLFSAFQARQNAQNTSQSNSVNGGGGIQ